MKKEFYSNGKLLLTGEYVVLDGATALAIPTSFGQSLKIESGTFNGIHWRAYDYKNSLWLNCTFSVEGNTIICHQDIPMAYTLMLILQKAKQLNPVFLCGEIHINATTHLDFPNFWGLGTSSTLINNIAQWAEVDAFTLLRESFGGSGYDIAAAQNDSPILYTLNKGQPLVEIVTPTWDFTEHLYFVHLNQKQDSKEGIARYKAISDKQDIHTQVFSDITQELLICKTLERYSAILTKHEQLISKLLKIPTIKKQFFPDYPGLIKSLGAWGGDFILVTGNTETPSYFIEKGYTTVIPYQEMIL
ncbi:MAG: GHMP kinase [Bacteroidetes bacterium]|nr:GHMP kinase [Bacteroidota bacterium]